MMDLTQGAALALVRMAHVGLTVEQAGRLLALAEQSAVARGDTLVLAWDVNQAEAALRTAQAPATTAGTERSERQ